MSRTTLAILMIVAATGSSSAQQPTTASSDGLTQVFPRNSGAVSMGSATNFKGEVTVRTPFRGSDGSRVGGATVSFAPGAHTAWHSHPMGQTLVVTDGCGWTQARGGKIERVCQGDVAWIGPGVPHWHGATPTTSMAHVAISETVEGAGVTWLEHVSDAEYGAGPR